MNSNTESNLVRYDKIGIGYDSTRRADRYLSQKMFDFIHSGREQSLYVDVGCGTGNYTSALYEMGLNFVGIDPSDEMLNKAQQKNNEITWKKGTAENIELPSESIDGALVSLTMHHWNDLNTGFKEIQRVMKKEAKVVIFTSTPEQTKSFWLNHYFPQMIEDSCDILPRMDNIEKAFKAADMEIIKLEPYFIKPDLEDWFLYCGKHDPKMYFNEEIRRGISSFSLIALQNEISNGLQKMKVDVESGEINNVIKKHENDIGDYLFIVGHKK